MVAVWYWRGRKWEDSSRRRGRMDGRNDEARMRIEMVKIVAVVVFEGRNIEVSG